MDIGEQDAAADTWLFRLVETAEEGRRRARFGRSGACDDVCTKEGGRRYGALRTVYMFAKG